MKMSNTVLSIALAILSSAILAAHSTQAESGVRVNAKERRVEKQFSFPTPGSVTTKALVFADERNRERKVVIFEPFVRRSDGDLYHAALESLWNIYGKKRGLFQLEEARTEHHPSLGGSSICWPIYNPKQSFCVFPMKDSRSRNIFAMIVWIK
jgi:hypothetical protein